MKINKYARNLLIAMAIGDGHIRLSKNKKKGSLIVEHGEKQKEYCLWKAGLLSPYYKVGFYKNNQRFHVSYSKFQGLINKIIGIYPKKISKKILNRIGVIGLAILYMDDGCIDLRKNKNRDKVKSRAVKLGTNWEIKEANIIKEWLKEKYNIDCYIKYNKTSNKYFHVLSSTSSIEFLELIKPHVPKFMYYKICPRYYNNANKIKYNLCNKGCNTNCEFNLDNLFCRNKCFETVFEEQPQKI